MRIVGLDILRSVAILLVLFRHSQLFSSPLYDFGWLGVDLFFVLSGFLVSGLIFKEYKKRNKLNIKRFLLRRGFKIYPAFYIFLVGSIIIEHYRDGFIPTFPDLLGEVFYLQSYLSHIWTHTWSLAVEEHFYLGLALISFIAYKTRTLGKKQLVISTLIALIVLSFCMRLSISYPHRNEPFFSFMATHLRSDGILIGVLIAYLYHFTEFFKFFTKWRWAFLIVSIGLMAPGFYYVGGGYFMNTAGLSLVNLGFGILTLFSLSSPIADRFESKFPSLKLLSKPIILFFTLVGKHSYSIYLWHIACRNFMNDSLHYGPNMNSLIFFILSISVGVILSIIIERPFLKLRQRYVP